MKFSLRALSLGTRCSFRLAFSLPEGEQTLTALEGMAGDGAVRECTVVLVYTTCAGVVEPLIGSRGTNTDVFTTDLLAPEVVDDSGVL